MSVTVRIPGPLRRFTQGQGKLDVEASTLRDILVELSAIHEGLQTKLFDENSELRSVVCIFIGETDVRMLAGLDTEVHTGQTVALVLPVAGA